MQRYFASLKIKIINLYKTNILLFYCLAFIIFIILAFIIQSIFYNTTLLINNYYSSYVKTLRENSREKKYNSLLKNQAKNEKKSQIVSTKTNRKARGNYMINFIYTKPPSVSETHMQKLIDNLENKNSNIFDDCSAQKCISNISLNYLPTYFSNEASEYNIDDFKINVKINKKIYTISDLNKIGDFAYIWEKDPFGVSKLQEEFEKIITLNNFDSKELYVFLYFDDTFKKDEAARENSFYEYKKFRSFADEDLGRIYINVYDFASDFSKDVTEISAHEILHLFHASDKYTEDINDSNYCSEKGIGNVDKIPTFPQKTGDIMCLFIEYQEGYYKRGHLIDGNLVINKYTAEEIGWMD